MFPKASSQLSLQKTASTAEHKLYSTIIPADSGGDFLRSHIYIYSLIVEYYAYTQVVSIAQSAQKNRPVFPVFG